MGIDPDKARERLHAERFAIEGESELAKEARSTVELDQQSVGRLSRMNAMQAQQMAQAQERTRQAQLTRIDMAMRRIEDGEYGYCVDCDNEIAEKRLEVDPMAERCINCA